MNPTGPTSADEPSPGRRRGRQRLQEAVLVATFVTMAAYETAEMWFLEAHPRSPGVLGVALHALQVAVILVATRTVLRAWRDKTAHEEALGRMVEKVIFAQEEERRRVAYELHDGVSPLIVSAKQHVETCRDVGASDPARAAHELDRGVERLQQAIVETRRVLRALRPSTVDADGLAAAVRRSLDEVSAAAGFTVAFEQNLGDDRLPPAVETAAFRITQEALANATRHAHASRLDVTLRREPDALYLEVRDRGDGFTEAAASPQGLGLTSMRERARLLGGECVIESERGAGTTVRARLPLQVAGGA
jgi:signal transduction histidine kinase